MTQHERTNRAILEIVTEISTSDSARAGSEPGSASLGPDARVEQAERLLIDPDPGWVLNYGVMTVLSAAIAGLGMRLDSAPIVIGAMLVAPVMRPILGLGFASLTAVERRVVVRLLVVMVVTSFVLVGVGWLFTVLLPSTEVGLAGEVIARTAPDVRDFAVALAAGAVGAFAILRPRVAESISGVAIAVALVPPPVAAGIAFGEGSRAQATGALLLYAANLVAIVFATVVTALVLRVIGERPFPIYYRRLLTAGGVVTLAGLALVIPLYGAFNASVDEAQAERDRARRAATLSQLSDAATIELDSWIANSDQPDLGVVSVDIPIEVADGVDTAVSVVLLGGADAYIPSLGDLENRIATAIERPVVLSMRLVDVSDQVSSRAELRLDPISDAGAGLDSVMEAALLEWTRGSGDIIILEITSPAPTEIVARIALSGDPPPVAELNRLLRDQLGSLPTYDLIIDQLLPGPRPARTATASEAVLRIDSRSTEPDAVCATSSSPPIILATAGDLTIETAPATMMVTSPELSVSTDETTRMSSNGIQTIIGHFDRDETGFTIVELRLPAQPPPC